VGAGEQRGGHALLTVPAGLTNHGTLRMESINNTWNSNVAVTGGGTFTNAAGGTVAVNFGAGGGRTLTGELINAGTVSIGIGFNLGGTGGTENHVNTGDVSLGAGAVLSVRGNSFVNQSGGVIEGSGTVSGNITGGGGAPLSNFGTVRVPTGATLVLTGPFLNFDRNNQTLHQGNYEVTGVLQFDNASIMTDDANILLIGSGGSTGGQIRPTGSGNDAMANLGFITANGSLTLRNGRDFATSAAPLNSLQNNGVLTIGTGVGTGSAFYVRTYTQAATAQLNVNSGRLRIQTAFTNYAGGLLTGGIYRLTGPDSLDQGVLQFPNADIVTNAATLDLNGPYAQVEDLTSPTPLDGLRHFVVNNGSFTIEGGRNFTTASDFANNGTLSIAPGPFAVSGNYSQSAAGVLNVALDGTTPGGGYGQLTANTATLAASATLNTQLGFVSTNGDTFTVLSAPGGVSGTFNGLPDGATFVLSGERFRANYPGSGVVLTHFANVATHFNVLAPATVTAGAPFDVTVQALDSNNQLDTGYTGTVHFRSADPHGASLPADYTFQPGDAGQISFTAGATLYTAGTWDVTASDPDSGITGSANVAVDPAAADHLVFLQPPTDTAAGQTLSPVLVAVVDQFGNIVTSDNSDTVTLSLGADPSGGAATLSGTLTVTFVNGVATFSDLSIDTAGAGYTLHASIGGGLPELDSDPFNIL
jgi:hypothetical protein